MILYTGELFMAHSGYANGEQARGHLTVLRLVITGSVAGKGHLQKTLGSNQW